MEGSSDMLPGHVHLWKKATIVQQWEFGYGVSHERDGVQECKRDFGT